MKKKQVAVQSHQFHHVNVTVHNAQINKNSTDEIVEKCAAVEC